MPILQQLSLQMLLSFYRITDHCESLSLDIVPGLFAHFKLRALINESTRVNANTDRENAIVQ